MIRRPRRSIPASLVAVVLLAAAVLVAASCVQLLLGDVPLLPLAELGRLAATVAPPDPAVIAGGVLAAVIGLVLLWTGLAPGAATVLPLADGGTGIDTGVTRRSLDKALTHAAAGVEGVEHARVRCTRRRATVTVGTGLAEPATVRAQVHEALIERLSDLTPDRAPRVSVKVTTVRNP